jgi:hypothetical protein
MNIRVAPAPLLVSVQPLIVLACWSMVTSDWSSTLSKTRLASSVGNENRSSAAWSVGAISPFRPFSKVTP